MDKTLFLISKMDCPSEERLIRMKLEGHPGIEYLEFDISNRRLTIYHQGRLKEIEARLAGLNFGSKILSTEKTDKLAFDKPSNQSRVLWTVFAINLIFFVIEATTGLISRSMGLVADSLDMLADAFVYGISILVVGKNLIKQKKIARLAGYFQLTLAFLGYIEVVRRVLDKGQLPDFTIMIIVSALALVANAICLLLLQKADGKEEAHMKATMIFTSYDIIANIGVIIAGLLVLLLNSGIPDLVAGTIVFGLVTQGAFKILRLGK
ncbi:MAG: cation transporter [Bacteroidetes bacterium HGW-Bacteroidetes-22]|nr:MAG: cation transporter [Bacteroidetes bacterium HGW-Bacteroidetes-22]